MRACVIHGNSEISLRKHEDKASVTYNICANLFQSRGVIYTIASTSRTSVCAVVLRAQDGIHSNDMAKCLSAFY